MNLQPQPYIRRDAKVQAIPVSTANLHDVLMFVRVGGVRVVKDGMDFLVEIPALGADGVMIAKAGDWVIGGPAGDYYVLSDDKFKRLYTTIQEENDDPANETD